ncbi:hypothetical protein ACOMHN_049000 [Nucella lapillus]
MDDYMCSIGDLKNNLRILQSEAHGMKYNGEFDIEGLSKGNPHALLPLYNHVFTTYNPHFSSEVLESLDDNLYMKSDVRFMEAVYKVMRDMFHFKPSMTKEQFFTVNNFAERKVIMCIDIMRLVQQHCRFFGPKNPTNPKINVTSIVDNRRINKKSSTDLVIPEPSSDTGLPRKVAEKPRTKPLGINDDGWQVKVGYLRPSGADIKPKDSHKGEKSNKDQKNSMTPSGEQEIPPPTPAAKNKPADGGNVPDGDKGPRREDEEVPPKGHHPQHSDWDPTGAVESILAKVRDLPVQLTTFMKAVDGRLQNIEGRLEQMEGRVVREDSREFSSLDNPQDLPPYLKSQLDTMQARILLLENRAALLENKSQLDTMQARILLLDNRAALLENKTTSSGVQENVKTVVAMVEEKREFTPGPYVSLERGDDLFSGSLVSTFSPIGQDIGDFNPNNNDTLASIADGDRRLSSTPNQSLNARPPLPHPNHGSSSRVDGEKSGGMSTANGTVVWDNLDSSTQQQVERIRDMFKATQILLPSTDRPQQGDT